METGQLAGEPERSMEQQGNDTKQDSRKTIPDGFTLGMAMMDCLPVIFFSIGAAVLASRFESPLFHFGILLVILAGALKAGWKFVLALAKKDVPFLSRQMRYLMPAGFASAVAGLLVDRSRWSIASVISHAAAQPACIFFLIGLAGIVTLAWLGRHLDGHDAQANWKEQTVNALTQLFIMLGIIF